MNTIPTINRDETVIKLTRENERLRASLRELVDVLNHQLNNDSWITTLHKVQTAQVLLGDVDPFADDPHKMSAEEVIGDDDAKSNTND